MTNGHAFLLALVLAIVASSAAQPAKPGEQYDEPIGPQMEGAADGEVVAPSIDSRDPAWEPSYEWHSGEVGEGRGAASLVCEGRVACESYKAEEVAKASDSQTSTGEVGK